MKDVSKNRRAAAVVLWRQRRSGLAQLSPSSHSSVVRDAGLASSGAASGNVRNRSHDLRKAGTAAESVSSAHPCSWANATGSSLKRGGPVSRPRLATKIARTTSAAARRSRPHPPRGARSAAAGRDEDPVRVGGLSVARKGPVIGLLDWLPRSAIDDTSVHRARHIDLV